MTKSVLTALTGAAFLLALWGGSAPAAAASPAAATPLVGTFTITAGTCAGGTVSGSYIRMILPGGTADGPYMSNSDSACSDQSYTLLAPGTDGGLRTGSYQPNPSPAFDSSGNAKADRIAAPADYYGTGFAVSTNPTDPQTGRRVPAPDITATGSRLGGQIESWSVAWNNQYFNQGAPKPGGTDPGITSGPTGTYDAATGQYTLTWTSEVVGGPFNSFTGLWHLTGRFVGSAASPAASASASAATAAPGASPSPASPTASAAAPPSGAGRSTGAATAATAPASGPAGQPSSSGPASAGGTSAASRSTPTPAATSPSAVRSSVTKHSWQSPWWLVALLAALGAAGLAGTVLVRPLRLPAAALATLALAGLTTTSLLTATTTDWSAPAPAPARPTAAVSPIPAPAPDTTTTTTVPASVSAAVPQLASSVTPPDGGPSLVPTAAPAPAPARAAPTTSTTSTTAVPATLVRAAACPVGLSPPTESEQGGLQSLVGFAPAFGPFTAEAFAMASAYAPLLQLFGPVLAQYPALAPKVAPILDPLLSDWETLEGAGAAAVLPIYSPVREQALTYETRLADVIAPYSEALAGSAPASCVVDLEAALVSHA